MPNCMPNSMRNGQKQTKSAGFSHRRPAPFGLLSGHRLTTI